MKALIRKIRIWDGDGKDGFGDAVPAFITKVSLVEGTDEGRYELTILSPEAGRSPIEDCHVIVYATSPLVEASWKEFVHKTEFDGKGHAKDAAEKFVAYLNDEAPGAKAGVPTPYS